MEDNILCFFLLHLIQPVTVTTKTKDLAIIFPFPVLQYIQPNSDQVSELQLYISGVRCEAKHGGQWKPVNSIIYSIYIYIYIYIYMER